MALINWYVDPDAVGLGDGTSWTDAYNSQNAFEAAEQTDLVTDTNEYDLSCRSSSGTDDTISVLYAGWTTGASNTITINGDSTTGIWDDSKYVHYGAPGVATTVWFGIDNSYITINNMQFSYSTASTTLNAGAVGSSSGTQTNININNCIIKKNSVYTYGSGILLIDFSNNNWIVRNTIIYDFANGAGIRARGGSSRTNYAYNCLVKNCLNGYIMESANNFTVIDSVAADCADDFNNNGGSGTFTIDYCASDDGDGTNAITGLTWTNEFTDYANADFSFKSGSNLIDTGTTIAGNTADIIGTSRPQNSIYDVGPFEYIAGGNDQISGNVSTGSTVAGTIQNKAQLSGDISTGSVLTGTMVSKVQISGNVTTNSALTGVIKNKAQLSGNIDTNTVLTGNLIDKAGNDQISGNVNTGSTLTGVIKNKAQLSGNVDTNTVLTGNLIDKVNDQISGHIVTGSTLTGVIKNKAQISGNVFTQSILTGNLLNKSDIEGVVSISFDGSRIPTILFEPRLPTIEFEARE